MVHSPKIWFKLSIDIFEYFQISANQHQSFLVVTILQCIIQNRVFHRIDSSQNGADHVKLKHFPVLSIHCSSWWQSSQVHGGAPLWLKCPSVKCEKLTENRPRMRSDGKNLWAAILVFLCGGSIEEINKQTYTLLKIMTTRCLIYFISIYGSDEHQQAKLIL